MTGEEFVQVAGAGGLRRHDVRQLGEGGPVEGGGAVHARGVDHGGDRELVRHRVQGRGELGAVGHVAGGDRDPGAQRAQFRYQVVGAVGGHTAPAGQQEVSGARVGEPAGDPGAQRAGAAGDDDRAVGPGPPGASRRRPVQGSTDQPAHIQPGGAQRVLLLVLARGERGPQQSGGAVVQFGGQVDESAPGGGVLQAGDPSEAPQLGLAGRADLVGASGADGAPGQTPQRRVDPGLAQRGQQGHGVRDAHRYDGMVRVRPVGQSQQGHHACPRARRYRAVRRGELGGDARAERRTRPPGGLAVRVRGHQQPVAGQGGQDRGGHRGPGDAVAPAVDQRRVLAPAAPAGQGGHQVVQVVQRLPVGEGEFGGDGGQVAAVHGPPQRRVLLGTAGRGGRRAGLRPEPAALERVGGQLDPAGAAGAEHGRPVHGGAAHERLGQGEREPLGAAVVPAQAAHGGGGRAGRVDGVLHRGDEYRVRAHLQEHVVALGEEFLGDRPEQHGPAQIAVPVVGVQARGVERAAGRRGVEGDVPRARCDTGRQLGQLPLDPLHLGGVGGVVHGDAAGPYALGLALGEQFGQRFRFAGHDGGAAAVVRRDTDPAVPAGDAFGRVGGGQGHGHHAAVPGQFLGDQPAAQRHEGGAVLQGQSARHAGGGDLALRVSDHGGRLDTAGTPQAGQ
ncbi:hypothetical protein Save01_02232 [Streptomyces avermitilis]